MIQEADIIVCAARVLQSDKYNEQRDQLGGGKELPGSYGRVWDSVYAENLRSLADRVEKLKEGEKHYPAELFAQIKEEVTRNEKEKEESARALAEAAAAARAKAQVCFCRCHIFCRFIFSADSYFLPIHISADSYFPACICPATLRISSACSHALKQRQNDISLQVI